jgi:sugar lactone lactonase YvrE
MTDVQCIWQIPAALGEGPLWVAHENAVYWVDIIGRNVHRLSLADGMRHTWTFDTAVTSLATRVQGGFVCTIRDGFAWLDLERGTMDPISLPEAKLPQNRFNDGKIDRDGRYWAGSMHEPATAETGVLYRLDSDLSRHRMDAGYIISNGPTFSRDGRTLYHTDSMKRTIYAFDCDTDGVISNKRVFVQLTAPDEGAPDGMTVDSEDCIWLAHFGGARLTRYSPQGAVLQIIPLPVPNVTSCAFAGSELDQLIITTARVGMSDAQLCEHPLAGSLFMVEPGVRGLPSVSFGG